MTGLLILTSIVLTAALILMLSTQHSYQVLVSSSSETQTSGTQEIRELIASLAESQALLLEALSRQSVEQQALSRQAVLESLAALSRLTTDILLGREHLLNQTRAPSVPTEPTMSDDERLKRQQQEWEELPESIRETILREQEEELRRSGLIPPMPYEPGLDNSSVPGLPEDQPVFPADT
jgi:hypothetical protein